MIGVVRSTVLALLVALALGALGAFLTPQGLAEGSGEPGDLQAEIRTAIEGYFGAIMTGQPGKVAATLAPEFQILRADGSRYDAKTYPESSLPLIAEMPTIERLTITAEGDFAVASYYIDVNETLDGKVVETFAPRLSVLRKGDGGGWLMVAHGNFAAIEE
jgi:ketosteroid isomerase-like protein